MRSCISCGKNKNCDEGGAKNYRQYVRKRNRELKERYRCDRVNGLCKLDQCKFYKECDKKAKKKYEAWRAAFNKSKKEELEKLSKGDYSYGHSSGRSTRYE